MQALRGQRHHRRPRRLLAQPLHRPLPPGHLLGQVSGSLIFRDAKLVFEWIRAVQHLCLGRVPAKFRPDILPRLSDGQDHSRGPRHIPRRVPRHAHLRIGPLLVTLCWSALCRAGHYNAAGGLEPDCRPCPIGQYQPEEGAAACVPCNASRAFTERVGALSPAECQESPCWQVPSSLLRSYKMADT